jgi:hypothetical protein
VIPDFTEFVSASDGGSESAPGSGVVIWPEISLAIDAMVTRQVTVQLDEDVLEGTRITNTVTVTDDLSNGPDATPENNTDDDVDEVGPPGGPPTAVELLYFRVGSVSGRDVSLEWATAVEIDSFGFNIYRADTADGSKRFLGFVPTESPFGGGSTYSFDDTDLADGRWWYWLGDLDTTGKETFHGPVSALVLPAGLDLPERVFLPVVLS